MTEVLEAITKHPAAFIGLSVVSLIALFLVCETLNSFRRK